MSAYNTFTALAHQRYSCRDFLPKKVERKEIEKVIDAARLAPSACNKQPWTFHIVENAEKRNAIIECYNREWFKTAPIYIIAVGDHNEAWKRADDKDHTDIDIAIAVEHLCLAASTLGLGTCWVCNFDKGKCAKTLNLNDNEEPIAIIPIGYPTKSDIPEKKRKNINEIIKWQ